jgi:hypothetical protein
MDPADYLDFLVYTSQHRLQPIFVKKFNDGRVGLGRFVRKIQDSLRNDISERGARKKEIHELSGVEACERLDVALFN